MSIKSCLGQQLKWTTGGGRTAHSGLGPLSLVIGSYSTVKLIPLRY